MVVLPNEIDMITNPSSSIRPPFISVSNILSLGVLGKPIASSGEIRDAAAPVSQVAWYVLFRIVTLAIIGPFSNALIFTTFKAGRCCWSAFMRFLVH